MTWASCCPMSYTPYTTLFFSEMVGWKCYKSGLCSAAVFPFISPASRAAKLSPELYL